MARNYSAYQTQAFHAGIPRELMRTVRAWVLQQAEEMNMTDLGDSSRHSPPDSGPVEPTNDLGYAELADIVTVAQAFDMILAHIKMATEHETPAQTARAKRQFLKDAGGRVGKGVYRIALKGYYLSGE